METVDTSLPFSAGTYEMIYAQYFALINCNMKLNFFAQANFSLLQILLCLKHLLSIRRQIGGSGRDQLDREKGYIAADRKYQAFNYQQCYHIIATNKSQ